jgi:thioredoxin-like negative regulator of GroEL
MKQLLYFSAGWCGPCKTLGPIMEQAGQQINITKIDVDLSPEMVQRFGVRNVPTVVLVGDNQQEIRRFTGVKTLNEIINFSN